MGAVWILVLKVAAIVLNAIPHFRNVDFFNPRKEPGKKDIARAVRAIYIVAAEIAYADGNESAAELDAIVRLVRPVLGNPAIPDEEILADYRKYSSRPWTPADANKISTAYKIVIIEFAIDVALSDRVISNPEKRAIVRIARSLDLPNFVVEETLAKLEAGKSGGQSFSQQGRPPSAVDFAYQTLGLQKGASQKEIKRRYRELAMEHHPDQAPKDGREEATEKFKEIGDAYKILKAIAQTAAV